jgi:hypothetical protein
MKKARFLFGMIFWAVLVHGVSFGSQSGKAPEPTPSRSDEKSAANSSPDGSKDTQARGQKDENGKYSDENLQSFAAVKKGTLKGRPTANHLKPTPSRQQRSGKTPATSNLRTETRNALDSRQISSSTPSEVPNKPLQHPNLALPPPTTALNGQQFKNPRNPGARMTASGVSANATRGTAVINGSDIKRKP